jgi:hypothetical protein
MKDYLLQFRDQVFNGALSLYKRIFFSYLLLNLLVGIIAAIVIIPLMLQFLGWNFNDLINLNDRMQDYTQTMQNGGSPEEVFSAFFSQLHMEYLIPIFIVALIIYPWTMVLFLTLNDLEIREKNNNVFAALSKSISKKIFTLLGAGIVYYLLMAVSIGLFMLIVVTLMSVASVLGVLIGFVGFFILLIFLMRFILIPAAIVHGNMSLSESFGFSYNHITFKRSALLILMGIVLLIVVAIISALVVQITSSFQLNKENPMQYFYINQIFSNIFGALTGAFFMSSLSALYFRYSKDEIPDETIDHIIGD